MRMSKMTPMVSFKIRDMACAFVMQNRW
jgi:hypothetical protein